MFEVIHLLSGATMPPPILDSMVELYVSKRKFDLENLAWYGHYRATEGSQALIELYEKLPESSRLHFLLSPAIYQAVYQSKHRPVESINELITLANDELAFVQGFPNVGHRPGAETIWSPTGGRVLKQRGEEWYAETLPSLDSLVVIDFESPYARAILPSPLMYLPPEDFTDQERRDVITKIQDAYDYVDRLVPVFGRLIRNYTRAIRLRKCERLHEIGSEHVTDTIGEIRLLNPQRQHFNTAKMAETLVHESVHNCLSTYEYLNGAFVVSRDDKRYRPVSPWSGNPIPVASFSHAVFVWFTLYNMALRELDQNGLSEGERRAIIRRRNHYASGFLAPDLLSSYLSPLATYSRGFLSTVDRVQQIVRGMTASLDESFVEEAALAV